MDQPESSTETESETETTELGKKDSEPVARSIAYPVDTLIVELEVDNDNDFESSPSRQIGRPLSYEAKVPLVGSRILIMKKKERKKTNNRNRHVIPPPSKQEPRVLVRARVKKESYGLARISNGTCVSKPQKIVMRLVARKSMSLPPPSPNKAANTTAATGFVNPDSSSAPRVASSLPPCSPTECLRQQHQNLDETRESEDKAASDSTSVSQKSRTSISSTACSPCDLSVNIAAASPDCSVAVLSHVSQAESANHLRDNKRSSRDSKLIEEVPCDHHLVKSSRNSPRLENPRRFDKQSMHPVTSVYGYGSRPRSENWRESHHNSRSISWRESQRNLESIDHATRRLPRYGSGKPFSPPMRSRSPDRCNGRYFVRENNPGSFDWRCADATSSHHKTQGVRYEDNQHSAIHIRKALEPRYWQSVQRKLDCDNHEGAAENSRESRYRRCESGENPYVWWRRIERAEKATRRIPS